jgi:hypothetical protein
MEPGHFSAHTVAPPKGDEEQRQRREYAFELIKVVLARENQNDMTVDQLPTFVDHVLVLVDDLISKTPF